MIARFRNATRRFFKAEDGSSTVEFVIAFPVLFTLLLSGIELGVMTLKYSMLERAMDMTVRDIRLGTGTAPQHDDIKDTICERAAFIGSCDETIRLEMIQIDPRNWAGIDANVDCVDRAEEVAPVRNWIDGDENEMMFLRACVKASPMFPSTGLSQSLSVDSAGDYALVVTSAFVQEPR